MLGRFTALNGISTRRRSVELDRLMGIASVRTRENLEFSTRRDTDSAVRPATISSTCASARHHSRRSNPENRRSRPWAPAEMVNPTFGTV